MMQPYVVIVLMAYQLFLACHGLLYMHTTSMLEVLNVIFLL